MTKPDFWSRIHLALVQDDDPRVLVVLLLGSVFGIYARPLDLEHKQETGASLRPLEGSALDL